MNLENENAVRAVAQTAQTQHGVFTTSQAVALGMLPSTVRRRMTKGYYQEVYEGVFVIAGGADSWRRSPMAAVLSEEVLAAASHQTAAYLLGLVDRRGDEIHVVTRRLLRRPRSDIGSTSRRTSSRVTS